MKNVLLLSFMLVALIGKAQTLDFIKNANPGHSLLQKIKSTNQDRIFGTGYIFNSATYENVVYESTGNDDIFLAEFNQDGSIAWLVTAGSTLADDRPSDMVVDEENEFIYIAGSVGEGANFEQQTVTYEFRSAFLAKYDFSGNLIWVITPGELGGEDIFAMDIDSDGNIYVVGQIEDEATFDNFTFSEPGFNAPARCFLAAYTPDGALLLVNEINGRPQASDLHINNQNELLVAGSFYDSLRIDNDEVLVPTANQEDIYLSLFDLQGQLINLDYGTSPSRHYVGDIISKSNGDFLVAAWSNSNGSIQFDQDSLVEAMNFLLTYSGNTVSNISRLGEGFFLTRELLLTNEEELVATGMYTFEAALNGTNLPLDYSNEMFLIGYEDDTPDWYFTGNGALNDYGTTMCQLSNGDLFLGGYSGDSMHIEDDFIATGTFDINFYLAKFTGLEGVTSIQSVYKKELSFFPNPVVTEAILNLEDESFQGAIFELHSYDGKLLRREKISSTSFIFKRNDLSEGLYFWTISNSEALLSTGKMVVVE